MIPATKIDVNFQSPPKRTKRKNIVTPEKVEGKETVSSIEEKEKEYEKVIGTK